MTKKKRISKKGAKGIATRFAMEVVRDYKNLIKAVVLFGSTIRDENENYSDIDIAILIDDTSEENPPKDVLMKDMEKTASRINKKLSIQDPIPLTEFWEAVKNGGPVVFNIIREGEAIYDIGFFVPVKRLLKDGKIKGSFEVVEKLRERSNKYLDRAKGIKTLIVIEDCYQSMIERSHASLAVIGEEFTSPSNLVEAMKESLVRRKLMKSKDLECVKGLIDFRKKCQETKTYINGEDVDRWIEKTEDYVTVVDNLIDRILNMKLDSKINKAQLNMFDINIGEN